MKLSDIVDRIVVEPRKLIDYALDLDSPYGRHKALLLERVLGFTKENSIELIRQLEHKSWQAEIIFHGEDRFGKRYRADILIEGREDKQAVVRTGWLVPAGTRAAYLVTIYVRKR